MRLPLLVSVVLHALAVVLLLTIRIPETPRAHFARVTPIASPYRAPAPVRRTPDVQPVRPLRPMARAFRVPDRLPQPRLSEHPPLLLPDAPSIQAAPILVPDPPLRIADIPPPQVHRVLAATGAFDGTLPAHQAATHIAISTGTFGDATTAAAGSRSSRVSDALISSAAEILFKPRPAYTDEARRLRIEGEVLLEVVFATSGEARVLRTIRGLGHGLDENAIAAAREIQFRLAKSGDMAVDSTAIVHITFQLAY